MVRLYRYSAHHLVRLSNYLFEKSRCFFYGPGGLGAIEASSFNLHFTGEKIYLKAISRPLHLMDEEFDDLGPPSSSMMTAQFDAPTVLHT